MKHRLSFLPLLPALFCLAISVCGQANTGAIRGVLVDLQGATIPGQKIFISASDAAEGEPAKHTVTDMNGGFEFSGLRFGTYLLEFTVPGFEGAFKKRVSITAGHPVADNVQFVLQPCGDVDASEPSSITEKEKGEILRQMLVPYLPTATDDRKANLSTDNIQPEWLAEYKQQFTLVTQAEINRRGQKSDFPYLRVSQLKLKHGCVDVTLADLLAVPSDHVSMSGGAKTYEFRKIGNHWLGKILISVVF